MTINILIATINEGIQKIDKILLPFDHRISYIISHQITDDTDYTHTVLSLQQRNDVKYLSLNEKGLSKNRNNCLRYIDADFVYICDDDVRLLHQNLLHVIEKFQEDKDIDLLRCQIDTFEQKAYKQYSNKEYIIKHVMQLRNISSIEMIVRSTFLKEKDIWFDERFGIGAEYPTGEDFIFAVDVFRNNGKIAYYPLTIVLHENEGTGSELSDSVIYARGAVFARIFGVLGFFVDLYVSLKQRKRYKEHYTLYRYLKLMCLGSFSFCKKIKVDNHA